MARHSPIDPDVRQIVDRLVPLFISEGSSVNALQRALTDALPGDRSAGWIYPNRLHALLSEDPSRAVNTQTLEAVRFALDHLSEPDESALAAEIESLRDHVNVV